MAAVHPFAGIGAELASGGCVRRREEGWGRLVIDRPLPFLALYRRPAELTDPATDRLVSAEAAYLVAPGGEREHPAVARLVVEIAAAAREQLGVFLLLEVWAAAEGEEPRDPADVTPRFRIFAPEQPGIEPVVQTLRRSLEQVRVEGAAAAVSVVRDRAASPPGEPLLAEPAGGLFTLGIEARPIWRDPRRGHLYPVLLMTLRRGFSAALKEAFFELARGSGAPVTHPAALGRRTVEAAAWQVDRRLAEVGEAFDLLLGVTPVNAEEAWEEFRDGRFDRLPTFRYRPLPFDPELAKRRLYALPIDDVEDPTLALLFREKQEELDRQITLLLDRETPRFLHGSLTIYGELAPSLVELAGQILDHLAGNGGRGDDGGGFLDAEAFARLARAELCWYQERLAGFEATVELRADLPPSMMVSRGHLLIGCGARVARRRAEALLHHEIGTHVLTYYNGRAQGLRQLYLGLAGYEALQEGLAVFAEHLCGGLTAGRLRLLAARVIAVDRVVDGASLIDVFRELSGRWGLPPRAAFNVALRVCRGGGFTKDAIYLRGLADLVAYLGLGGELAPLYVGKIADSHVPIVRELALRGIVDASPLTPRFFANPAAQARLERVRRGVSLTDLIDPA